MIAALFAAIGCTEKPLSNPEPAGDKSSEVVLLMNCSSQTKSSINESADGFLWDDGDKIAVWAKSSSGSYTLSNQPFNLYARGFEQGKGYFTSTLSRQMEAGTYTYYITYPVPQSASGTTATFTIPEIQDGKASNGVDITVSDATSARELRPATDEGGIVPIEARLHHLLHFFRFYLPEGENPLGEPISKIVVTMPQPIAGTLTADVTAGGSATLSNGRKSITLELKRPLDASSAVQYAVAGIFPPSSTYGADDVMTVELQSENKSATVVPIPLSGRNFPAGHVTGVKLRPVNVQDLFDITFTLGANRLGEEVKEITLSLPEGSGWPGGSSSYTYSPGHLIAGGDKITIKTANEAEFRALSGKSVTIRYESENAIVSQTVTMPDMSSGRKAGVTMEVPYLFFEDFHAIAEDFHSYDEHATSNPGNRGGYEFIGWSGARVGGMAATSIRISAHRETSASYPARCDSPFLTGLKHTADEFGSLGKNIELEVTFNYAMNREEGGLGKADVGMELYFGYSTKSGAINSQNSDGSYGGKIYMKEFSGSFTTIGNEMTQTLSGMGNDRRISWKTYCEYNAGLNNSTCFLYLDNIRVSIKK